MSIIFFTGHRSEKIPDPARLQFFVEHTLKDAMPDAVINGLANGFDLWAAEVAINLNIPVVSAMPWTTHKPRKADKELYDFVIKHSEEVYPVVEADSYPGPWAYQRRNEWMVDQGDKGLAFWDGSEGGTFNCIRYAFKVGKPIRNIHKEVTFI